MTVLTSACLTYDRVFEYCPGFGWWRTYDYNTGWPSVKVLQEVDLVLIKELMPSVDCFRKLKVMLMLARLVSPGRLLVHQRKVDQVSECISVLK